MKKNILVLFTLSLMFVVNTSCKTDDDKTTNEEPKLTATNYIYEGDLRKFYLKTTNTSLENEIKIWQEVPSEDPDYQETQAKIEVAQAEIQANKKESTSILSPDNVFFIDKPRLPPIPIPSPCSCLHIYNSIKNIVFMSGTNELNLSIVSNIDGKNIVDTTEGLPVETIPNKENLGKYQPFIFEQPDFVGVATLNIKTDTYSYSIEVNFQKLP